MSSVVLPFDPKQSRRKSLDGIGNHMLPVVRCAQVFPRLIEVGMSDIPSVDVSDVEARRTYEEVFDKLMHENQSLHPPVSESGDAEVKSCVVNEVVPARRVPLRLVVNNRHVEVKWLHGRLHITKVG